MTREQFAQALEDLGDVANAQGENAIAALCFGAASAISFDCDDELAIRIGETFSDVLERAVDKEIRQAEAN